MKKFKTRSELHGGWIEFHAESLEKAQALFPKSKVEEVLSFWQWIKKYARFEIR